MTGANGRGLPLDCPSQAIERATPVATGLGRVGPPNALWIEAWRRLLHRPEAQSVWNAGATIVRAGARTGWSLAIPAVMSMQSFGQYALLQTTVATVGQVSLMGASQVVLREPLRTIPLPAAALHSLLVAATLLVIGGACGFKWSSTLISVIGFGVATTFIQTIGVARAKSKGRFGTILIAEVTTAAMLLAGAAIGTLVLASHFNYATVYLWELAAGGVAGLIAFIGLRRELGGDWSCAGAQAFLKSIYSVGLLVVLDALVYRRIELLFLARTLRGSSAVAIFAFALQLSQVILLLPAALIEPWGPAIASRRDTGDQRGLRDFLVTRERLFMRLYAAVVVIELPVVVVLLRTVFAKYSSATPYIYAILAVRILSGIAGFYSSSLYALRRERELYPAAFVGGAMSLALNATLTLRWGLAGALASYAATQMMVLMMTIGAYRRLHRAILDR